MQHRKPSFYTRLSSLIVVQVLFVFAAFVRDANGLGAVINSSRAIIFAYEQEQYAGCSSWQSAVEHATRDTIERLADGTTAGRLREG